MPSFMSLPLELRDEICTYVILAPKRPPPSINQTSEQILQNRQTYREPALHSLGGRDLVKYLPEDEFVTTSTPLMLVSRQLHAETVANVERLGAEAHSYDLDIILVDETLLCPTWIRVPALTTRVNRVNVTLRIAGSYAEISGKYEGYSSYRGFVVASGMGPAMAWTLYCVFERFFKAGPVGNIKSEADEARAKVQLRSRIKRFMKRIFRGDLGRGKDIDTASNASGDAPDYSMISYAQSHPYPDRGRGISIKSLNINVETPSGIDQSRFGEPLSGVSTQDFIEDHVLDPDYLTNFIWRYLTQTLTLYDNAWYGSSLYEFLDEVVLRKDGEDFKRLDAALSFRDLKLPNDFESGDTRDTFNEWKRTCAKKRRRAGLRVLKD
ncbi:hypothetical protein K505DRAFT_326582 [Melanomma pulvis-pyrius CBS 109.77]|uniref:Uncharacterized protein n=1 Tax=Melanomma pulvis-pyrius CBS 109.77 TaxID=1314802 RepID=A0A6A6X6C8_9PLEO|nr:hypothetical protein K505DRAFT_326582 [Melanomma pulvis-pyrius CBS 109.77]